MENYNEILIDENIDATSEETVDNRTVEEMMYDDFCNSKSSIGPANKIESLAPLYAMEVIKNHATYENPLTYGKILELVKRDYFLNFDIKKLRRVVNTLVLADTGVVSKNGANEFYYFAPLSTNF